MAPRDIIDGDTQEKPARLDILYRDEYLIAIQKPSGLLVHRSPIDKYETRFAIQQLRDQIGQRVYPVHRLDKPTSGVLLFALDSATAKQVNEHWSTTEKTYLAVVRGYAPEHQMIDHALRYEADSYGDANLTHTTVQQAKTQVSRLASIELNVTIDRYPSSRYSLVKCQPYTGRKHQIRRHLKRISHPIIGDAKHGKGKHNRYFANQLHTPRLLLAATQLKLKHPITRQTLCINAPLEGCFAELIQRFDWNEAVPTEWLPNYAS
ncbi:pseudouridine synthase [Gilvimarinus sp. SDUM040013]|uniref:tRNA pseudouridine synthase C n=1 Tax=Gilvimarinus gilvus TaxID=3058038 RepID=A0ABU4RXV4_9GAMM|nr:pseudouridine synthase [Gilvimarinus sp. SDUM040013]MDO3386466.1 pseudouridine synthase [Gilvimarinus sp. SDUM040013]MDX6849732.1 pseudouridine synthase [Gilvimarinus sp. SDUM040013]